LDELAEAVHLCLLKNWLKKSFPEGKTLHGKTISVLHPDPLIGTHFIVDLEREKKK